MKRMSVGLAVLAVVAVACTSADPPPWPDIGSVTERYGLDVGAFEAIEGETVLDAHSDGFGTYAEVLARVTEDDVLHRHYPYLSYFLSISGGVEVFFLDSDDRFYLRDDHMAGHIDGFIGPFVGDPREQLVDAAYPLED